MRSTINGADQSEEDLITSMVGTSIISLYDAQNTLLNIGSHSDSLYL